MIVTTAIAVWQEETHRRECVATCIGRGGLAEVSETWTGHACRCQEGGR